MPAGFTIMWVGTGQGDWDTATNWKDTMGVNRVPNSMDSALINVAGVSVTHNMSIDDAVNTLVSSNPISLSAGSITFGTDSQINAGLDLSGGKLAGASASLTSQSFTWEGGTVSVKSLTSVGAAALSGTATKFLDTGTFNTPAGATLTGTGGLTLLNNSTWNDGMALDNQSTLAGNGTFQGTFTNDGLVSPGQSPGRIKIFGGYAVAAAQVQTGTVLLGNGTLKIEIGGNTAATGYDQLEVNGTLALSGNLQLSQLNNFVPEVNDMFTIVQRDNAGPTTGTFSGLPAGSTIMVAGKDAFNNPYTATYQISYTGGALNNSVVLTNLTVPTHVASDMALAEVQRGGVAMNTGKWGDARAGDTVVLHTSIGTIVQNGGNNTGTWSWSYNTAGKMPGSQQVTITADDGHGGVSSTMFMLTIDKDSTSPAMRADINPSTYGQAVALSATVRILPPGSGVPSGTVTFMDGTSALQTVSLDAAAHATFSTAALSAGNHALTAVYNGDSIFATATSLAYGQTVHKASTSTALTTSPTMSVYGQLVSFTATVTALAPGGGTPNGTVTFKDGTTALGTIALNNAGEATFATRKLSVGSHTTITAVYNGSGNFNSSPSPSTSDTVSKASTSDSMIASMNPAVVGTTITLTAVVRVMPPGSGTPTGVVTFKEGTVTLGSGTLDATVHATMTTASLAVGNHAITAVYGGDGNFTGSTAPVYGEKITSSSAATGATGINSFLALSGAEMFPSPASLSRGQVAPGPCLVQQPIVKGPPPLQQRPALASDAPKLDVFFASAAHSRQIPANEESRIAYGEDDFPTLW
jgi:hypothetical protein